MAQSRYSRQIAFYGIGSEGQDKLLNSTVAIVGVGALGTVLANILCRSGIGRLKLIDRDYVEFTNLQRQILFTEDDAIKYRAKSIAACDFLSKVNSEIKIEPIVTELNAGNIDNILNNVTLILDAVDNWETRFLINDWSVKNKTAWIYAAALGSQGMTMNFRYNNSDNSINSINSANSTNSINSTTNIYETNNIGLGQSVYPCLRCFVPSDQYQSQQPTCATAGILAMTTSSIASIQAAEAVKIILNSPDIRDGLLTIDLWNNRFKNIKIEHDPNCQVCVHGNFEYLSYNAGMKVQKICGRNSIQISPESQTEINLESFAATLANIGQVEANQYMLIFSNEEYQFVLFKDGRAIIENAKNEFHAKTIYNEFIGLR
ncbi:MAG: ThiF family adenylyltransferase [Planctomycetaceae bacterium]|jgi:adenylyltransferase/sulfurtransferase|nr:ThiF family adenylyltransferase [Planctomycetaceae bacterium]